MNQKYRRRATPSYNFHMRKLSNGLSLPRNLLHPTRIAALAIIILIVLFINFQSGVETPSRRRDDGSSIPERGKGHGVQKPIEGAKSGSVILGKEGVVGKSGTASGKVVDKRKPGSRIAIVSFITEQKSYMHLSLKNHDHYARKHNYTFNIDYQQNNPRGAMWHKFVMIENAINTGLYDWIWWMDFDTLITNTSIKAEDVIAQELANVTHAAPEDIDFLFTPDCFQLNAGSFFTRAHARSIEFFDRVRAYHTANASQEHQLSEQDCMRDILFPPVPDPSDPEHPREAETVLIVPPPSQRPNSPEEKALGPPDNTDSQGGNDYGYGTSRTTTWVPTSEFSRRFIVIPQWRINAFPEEIRCWDTRDENPRKWERGMFTLHFAGAWAYIHDEDPTGGLMKKYGGYIEW